MQRLPVVADWPNCTFIALAAAFALSACAMKLTGHRDPFAGTPKSHPTYDNVTLGLMWSDASKTARQYAQDYYMNEHDAERLFEDIEAAFRRNFKTVVRIAKAEEAQAIKADLIAVLDVSTQFPDVISNSANITVKAAILRTDNTPLEAVKVEGVETVIPAYSTFGAKHAIEEAAHDVIKKLDTALSASVKLAEFSKTSAQPGRTRRK